MLPRISTLLLAFPEGNTKNMNRLMKKAKVLVVDDEKDVVFFLKSNLEREGDYRVFTASDGEEGLRLARAHKPDLIILDVVMPKMDGFAVLKALKNFEETKHTPVIMLTVKKEPENLDRGITFGADFYLPKPFTLDNLTKFIELIISDKPV